MTSQGNFHAILRTPQSVELLVEGRDDLHPGGYQHVLVVPYDGRIGPISRTADQQGRVDDHELVVHVHLRIYKKLSST